MAVQLLTEKITKRTLILLFLGLGITIAGFRGLYFGAESVLPEDTVWKISLSGRFQTTKNETTILVARPKTGRYTKLIVQRVYHPDFKVFSSTSSTRYLRAKSISTGASQLIIEYHLQLSQIPTRPEIKKIKLEPLERQQYIESNDELDLSLASLKNLNEFLHRDVENKEQLIQKIFLYSQKPLIATKQKFSKLNNIIQANKATNIGRVRLMIALCRLNDIPARLVAGFVLEEAATTSPHYWLEIYDEDKLWIPYDPEKGFEGIVPPNYIPFDYEKSEIFSVENGRLLSAKYSITEDVDILSIVRLEHEKNMLDILDLTRLEINTRETLVKILILPFCVLLVAFLRHVLGLFPYGTFTPALLALAMVYAEPVITLVISGIVILLALLGRSVLPKKLARSPRLSLIFTFVAISMVFSISALSYFSFNPGAEVILIPTIILVAIVDRFYSYMDEKGTYAALLRLGVTVLIALFCMPILTFDQLGMLAIKYPEVHFLTAALVFAFSSYQGKKLTDYKYLKLLGENKSKTVKKQTSTEDIEAPS